MVVARSPGMLVPAVWELYTAESLYRDMAVGQVLYAVAHAGQRPQVRNRVLDTFFGDQCALEGFHERLTARMRFCVSILTAPYAGIGSRGLSAAVCRRHEGVLAS